MVRYKTPAVVEVSFTSVRDTSVLRISLKAMSDDSDDPIDVLFMGHVWSFMTFFTRLLGEEVFFCVPACENLTRNSCP